MPRFSIIRILFLLALLAGSAAACSRGADAGGDAAESEAVDLRHDVVAWRPGVTHAEFMALPDSVRLASADSAFGTGRGVAVEVALQIDGRRGRSVPLAYSLHDARNGLPFVSRTSPITPDAARWSRQGQVWLPVPSPGRYYVRVVLNDSTGRREDGPRTQDFTIE